MSTFDDARATAGQSSNTRVHAISLSNMKTSRRRRILIVLLLAVTAVSSAGAQHRDTISIKPLDLDRTEDVSAFFAVVDSSTIFMPMRSYRGMPSMLRLRWDTCAMVCTHSQPTIATQEAVRTTLGLSGCLVDAATNQPVAYAWLRFGPLVPARGLIVEPDGTQHEPLRLYDIAHPREIQTDSVGRFQLEQTIDHHEVLMVSAPRRYEFGLVFNVWMLADSCTAFHAKSDQRASRPKR